MVGATTGAPLIRPRIVRNAEPAARLLPAASSAVARDCWTVLGVFACTTHYVESPCWLQYSMLAGFPLPLPLGGPQLPVDARDVLGRLPGRRMQTHRNPCGDTEVSAQPQGIREA